MTVFDMQNNNPWGFKLPDETHLLFAARDVQTYAESVRNQLTGYASATAVAGWPNKAARARRVLDGTASEADTVALQAEASLRGKGESVAELAQKQLASEAQYGVTAATIDGMESAAIRRLTAERPDAFAVHTLLAELQAQAQGLLARITQT